MSIVVLEAGAVGTPVLVTDQCGLDELEQVGGGFVVPASVDGLERGLKNALSDLERLKSVGAMLQRYTREKFDWDRIAQRYVQLYGEMLASSAAR